MSTVEEVAKTLRVSKMTVYRMIDDGELPGYRIRKSIRVPTTAVWNYLKGSLIDPTDLSRVKAL